MAQEMLSSSREGRVSLSVDLDYTLLKTDTLWEQFFVLVRTQPSAVFQLPGWLLRGGRAHLKTEIAQRVQLNPEHLPYRPEVIEYIMHARAAGRPVILATAAHERIARPIADHLGIFDEVLATNAAMNLKTTAKAKLLTERFGRHGFDHIGDCLADVPVWKESRRAVVVGNKKRLVAAARHAAADVEVLPASSQVSILRALWKALRPYQWVKNLLVFVPLMLAHHVSDLNALLAAVLAWVLLSLTASATYLVNDLLDAEPDRQHSWKKHRPFAAGDLTPVTGVGAFFALITTSAFLALWLLPLPFVGLLGVYAVSSLTYSFWLKRVPIVDVVVLSGLYTLRLLIGSEATGIPVSFWLLTFAIFFFLSLALLKRFAELTALPTTHIKPPNGRGYTRSDRTSLAHLGTGTGYISVLVLALYINSDEVIALYGQPKLLWSIAPLLLYWISRLWFLAHRNRVHEDPIVFAFRDPTSYAVGLLTLLFAFLAV